MLSLIRRSPVEGSFVSRRCGHDSACNKAGQFLKVVTLTLILYDSVSWLMIVAKNMFTIWWLQDAEICSLSGDSSWKNGDVWTGVGVDGLRETREVFSVEDWTMRTRQPCHALRISRILFTCFCSWRSCNGWKVCNSLLWNLATLHDVIDVDVLRDVGMWRPHRLTGADHNAHTYVSSYIFYILSYFFIFSILFNCYFWVERVKSSDRLEVRASSNASRLFSVHPPWPPVPCQTESNTNLTRLVRNVEYSNTRIEAGNTDPTTPLAYDLSTCLCSDPPVPGLAMLFNAFQKWEYAIPYLILRDTAWKTFDWNMIEMCVVCGNRLDNFDCGKSTLKWLESFGICVQGYSAWILPRPFWWVVVSVSQHLNGQTSRASAPPSFDFFSRETKRRLFL